MLSLAWYAADWFPGRAGQVRTLLLVVWISYTIVLLLGRRHRWFAPVSSLCSSLWWAWIVSIAAVTANVFVVAFFVEIGVSALQGSLLACAAATCIGIAAVGVAALADPAAMRASVTAVVALLFTGTVFSLLIRRLRVLSAAGSTLEEVTYAVHGVKNSLSGVSGFAELLSQNLSRDDPRHTFARRIREGLEEAHDRLTGLLESPAAISGETSDRTSVSAAVRRAVASTSAVLDLHHVTWRIDISDALFVALPCDVLETVVNELIHNAVRAMPGGGNLCFTTRSDPPCLVIQDSGGGIPARLRERVFEPGLTARPEGHGLGLAGVRRLLARYGSRIRITDVDRGAEFELELVPASGPIGGTEPVESRLERRTAE